MRGSDDSTYVLRHPCPSPFPIAASYNKVQEETCKPDEDPPATAPDLRNQTELGRSPPRSPIRASTYCATFAMSCVRVGCSQFNSLVCCCDKQITWHALLLNSKRDPQTGGHTRAIHTVARLPRHTIACKCVSR